MDIIFNCQVVAPKCNIFSDRNNSASKCSHKLFLYWLKNKNKNLHLLILWIYTEA